MVPEEGQKNGGHEADDKEAVDEVALIQTTPASLHYPPEQRVGDGAQVGDLHDDRQVGGK